MRQTKVDHVLNGLADLVVKHERTITTQAKIIEVLREGLEHYAETTNWGDTHDRAVYGQWYIPDGSGYEHARAVLNKAKELEK
jgi:hypothetical protein